MHSRYHSPCTFQKRVACSRVMLHFRRAHPRPKHQPQSRHAGTVPIKCTNTMQSIMEERLLDRTSVIKLAFYVLTSYISREKTRTLTRHELVSDVEGQAPPNFPPYGDFAD